MARKWVAHTSQHGNIWISEQSCYVALELPQWYHGCAKVSDMYQHMSVKITIMHVYAYVCLLTSYIYVLTSLSTPDHTQ